MTRRTQSEFECAFHCPRRVVANLDGSTHSSDAGLMLLREVTSKLRIFRRLAQCFNDFLAQDRCEHGVEEMLGQRVLSLAMDKEDLNHHDQLRHDPLLAHAARKRDADQGARAGALDELKRIVFQIREQWKDTRIVVRADSGFCHEEILAWCEQNQEDYSIGLARN